mmetsp:Transcript_2912/g.12539  ORF Transcript_2912/g.12539 Transcript_2912/m.12539 type:complete len:204 (-) Transcript_2912:177-788(-)
MRRVWRRSFRQRFQSPSCFCPRRRHSPRASRRRRCPRGRPPRRRRVCRRWRRPRRVLRRRERRRLPRRLPRRGSFSCARVGCRSIRARCSCGRSRWPPSRRPHRTHRLHDRPPPDLPHRPRCRGRRGRHRRRPHLRRRAPGDRHPSPSRPPRLRLHRRPRPPAVREGTRDARRAPRRRDRRRRPRPPRSRAPSRPPPSRACSA